MRQTRVGTTLLAVAMLFGVYFLRGGSFGRTAPAFSLPEPDGGQVELASYTGRPVLLVFWTTSCPICQRELPMLNNMEWEFRDKGISVLTVCLGGEGDAREYLDSNRIALKTVYDANGKVGRAYSVGGVPRFVLVDKDGKIKRSQSGWANEDVLREWMSAVS